MQLFVFHFFGVCTDYQIIKVRVITYIPIAVGQTHVLFTSDNYVILCFLAEICQVNNMVKQSS